MSAPASEEPGRSPAGGPTPPETAPPAQPAPGGDAAAAPLAITLSGGAASSGGGAPPAPPPAPVVALPPPASGGASTLLRVVTALSLLLALGALGWAYSLDHRLRAAEQEFARRQQDSATQAVEARALARQADATSRDMTARLALLDARVAETSMQRGQVEELMQALSRSRDENVIADIEAAVRVAQQQSAITGSVDPLATALRQAEERLARMRQPRLERVRRAVLQDMDRVRAAGTVDIPTLTLRLDEVVRQVDELPLVAAVNSPGARDTRRPEPAASAAVPEAGWLAPLRAAGTRIWDETRQLVRVTRIERPEAALVAPDQAVFLRENVKLRLLHARLSLLSRQFDSAQGDIRQAQALLEKYFDRASSRRVQSAVELLKQTAAQSQSVVVPVPEATLAALGAAAAGR